MEQKDGNPLHEVRMPCDSMMNHHNVLTADKPIKFAPAKSALEYRVGDKIEFKEANYRLLASAFLAEIESKHT